MLPDLAFQPICSVLMGPSQERVRFSRVLSKIAARNEMNRGVGALLLATLGTSRVVFYCYVLYRFSVRVDIYILSIILDCIFLFFLYLYLFRMDVVEKVEEFFPRYGKIFIVGHGVVGWIFVSLIVLFSI